MNSYQLLTHLNKISALLLERSDLYSALKKISSYVEPLTQLTKTALGADPNTAITNYRSTISSITLELKALDIGAVFDGISILRDGLHDCIKPLEQPPGRPFDSIYDQLKKFVLFIKNLCATITQKLQLH
jgi:hypothetical protein